MKLLVHFLLLFGSLNLQGADVDVTVVGVNQTKGTLLVGFYNDARNFRTKELDQSPRIDVTKPGPITVTALDLEPGIYAVAVIWDLNNNGVLDTKGRFKIPTEPYGFSNNPRSRFGPPEFEQCTVRIPAEGGTIQILLK